MKLDRCNEGREKEFERLAEKRWQENLDGGVWMKGKRIRRLARAIVGRCRRVERPRELVRCRGREAKY